MKQETSELSREYRAAIDAKRAAETEFELRRGEFVAALERLNRLRASTSAADTSATEKKRIYEDAFRETDGVLNLDLKHLRRDLRDAQELSEDYQVLLSEAEQQAQHSETRALIAAREMESARLGSMRLWAFLEIEKAAAEISVRIRRAMRMLELSRPAGGVIPHAHSPYEDPEAVAFGKLRASINNVPEERVTLPDDLAKRANIAPLKVGDMTSAMALAKRAQAAREAASIDA